jgi:hypothetical protein
MAALEVYGALQGRCLSYLRQSNLTAVVCLLQCKPAGLAAGQLVVSGCYTEREQHSMCAQLDFT